MYVFVACVIVYPRFTKSFSRLLKFVHASASLDSGTFSICSVLAGSKGNLSPPDLQCIHILTVLTHLENENDSCTEPCFSFSNMICKSRF